MQVIQFGEERAGIGGVNVVGMGVGDAGRQIVRLVDEEERAGGIEARLVEEKGAVRRSEDVVVVADPDVVEGERRAGDFVRADPGGLASGAEGGEVAGLIFEEVKTGKSGGRPAGFEVGQVGARVAVAVKGVVDAVFGFVANVPGRHGRDRG